MAPTAFTQPEGRGRARRAILAAQVVAVRGRGDGDEPASLLGRADAID
jgi:hypothetical protein